MSYNPFERYKKGFNPETFRPLDFMNKVAIGTTPQIHGQRQAENKDVSTGAAVGQLPRHLYTPEGARSLDLRRLVVVSALSDVLLMSFTAPEGTTCFFISYAIFNDGLDASLIEFIPTVENQRIFPFHGNPNDNFRISLGLGPDLTNNSLIESQLQLDPGKTLRWRIINNSAVDVTMGVRMKGYIDSTTSRTTRVFGG